MTGTRRAAVPARVRTGAHGRYLATVAGPHRAALPDAADAASAT
ncbi:hypothetical protein [Streptomyces sp. NPDC089795]